MIIGNYPCCDKTFITALPDRPLPLAVEADEKHGIGLTVVMNGKRLRMYSAAHRLDWDLRDLAHDMYVEAKSHDEFCRDAYLERTC
jgi:hypothetical protein